MYHLLKWFSIKRRDKNRHPEQPLQLGVFLSLSPHPVSVTEFFLSCYVTTLFLGVPLFVCSFGHVFLSSPGKKVMTYLTENSLSQSFLFTNRSCFLGMQYKINRLQSSITLLSMKIHRSSRFLILQLVGPCLYRCLRGKSA